MREPSGASALMPIGHFARSAGLSVVALRHYDRVGVLAPAYVDPRTGYRRYRPEQLEKGRAIRRLRDLEVPLEVIREILEAEPENAARLLEEHRVRLEAQTWREQRLLHGLRQLIEGKERLMADDARTPANLEPGEQRQLASDLFNLVWSLLETPDRTQQQDDRMLNAAHASRFHWGEVGEPMHFARGEWQLSRVYAVLERPEPSLHHANRCLEICRANGIEDFDLAFAYEALARASAVAGHADDAAGFAELARQAGERIAEDEDRELLFSDLAGLPT
jgi:DNA-binding transcriptional MerR regulator